MATADRTPPDSNIVKRERREFSELFIGKYSFREEVRNPIRLRGFHIFGAMRIRRPVQ
jgi:hypothetical protein